MCSGFTSVYSLCAVAFAEYSFGPGFLVSFSVKLLVFVQFP